MGKLTFIVLILCCICLIDARRHEKYIKNDIRTSILCSQFAYTQGGLLSIKVNISDVHKISSADKVGLSFSNEENKSISSYLTLTNGKRCPLSETMKQSDALISAIIFLFNFNHNELEISYTGKDYIDIIIEKQPIGVNSTSVEKRDTSTAENGRESFGIPLVRSKDTESVIVSFLMKIPTVKLGGIYSVYFHHCSPPSKSTNAIVKKVTPITATLSIVERNLESYLSAGEQPMIKIYISLGVAYFVLTILWIFYLWRTSHTIYKTYYLMGSVLFLKGLSLLLHGINLYVLGKYGIHEEGWAVMYYITHLLKGSVLFVTIILIGTGWSFIKRAFTPNLNKVFLVVIPLQILANVASIIVAESDEGTNHYTIWTEIFIIVDLICCCLVVLPVVWSIRHLKMASQIDGKASSNLRKLKLFTGFYFMIITYIYMTRILVYLLNIVVPFMYTWSVSLFREVITLLFFLITGFLFRPLSPNAYLLLPTEDDDQDAETERRELEDVHCQSGATDGVSRVNRARSDSEEDEDNESSGTDTKSKRGHNNGSATEI